MLYHWIGPSSGRSAEVLTIRRFVDSHVCGLYRETGKEKEQRFPFSYVISYDKDCSGAMGWIGVGDCVGRDLDSSPASSFVFHSHVGGDIDLRRHSVSEIQTGVGSGCASATVFMTEFLCGLRPVED